MQMKLELVPVPVSDIDRAKAFYLEKVGFHADLHIEIDNPFHGHENFHVPSFWGKSRAT